MGPLAQDLQPLSPPPAEAFGGGELLVRDAATGQPVQFNTLAREVELDTELFRGRMLLLFKVPPGSKQPASSSGIGGSGSEARGSGRAGAFASSGGRRGGDCACCDAGCASTSSSGASLSSLAAAGGSLDGCGSRDTCSCCSSSGSGDEGEDWGPADTGGPDAQALFEGKQRLVWAAVQGRFKRGGVSFGDLLIGSEFRRPLRLPAPYITVPAAAWIAARLGGGLSLETGGERPHILAPLCAGAQIINVALPGTEPRDMLSALEDTSLLLGAAAPPTAAKRRALFRGAAQRAGRVWDPSFVYTFGIYDHSLDYSSFRLAYLGLDMVKVLGSQPMGFAIRDAASGAAVFDLEIWHRRMLPPCPTPQPAPRRAGQPPQPQGSGQRGAEDGGDVAARGPDAKRRLAGAAGAL